MHLGVALHQHDAQPAQHQPTEDGAPDRTAPDHRHIPLASSVRHGVRR